MYNMPFCPLNIMYKVDEVLYLCHPSNQIIEEVPTILIKLYNIVPTETEKKLP